MTNCTKCTVQPIVKEHMCEDCYVEHNAWLRALANKALPGYKFRPGDTLELAPGLLVELTDDQDDWYTVYETGSSLREQLHETVVSGLDKWIEESVNERRIRDEL